MLTPCISVEATAKVLTPHPYVESSNEPLPGRAPIETSTYGCGVNPAKLLAFEMHKIGGSQGLILTGFASSMDSQGPFCATSDPANLKRTEAIPKEIIFTNGGLGWRVTAHQLDNSALRVLRRHGCGCALAVFKCDVLSRRGCIASVQRESNWGRQELASLSGPVASLRSRIYM
jgi:hypothetical protein